MSGLLLIGGGGHCRACIDVIEAAGRFTIAGIVQPVADGTAPVLGYPVLGVDADLPRLLQQTPAGLVTVGQIKSPATRQRLFGVLRDLGAELPVVISPHAHCSRHARVGEGSILMHGSLVNAGAVIGLNAIVNSQALVEHDAVIGDHCHIATGARVNGGVRIGDGVFIGSGAVLREGITVGAGAVIGAGCVVLRDVPDGTVLRGGHG